MNKLTEKSTEGRAKEADAQSPLEENGQMRTFRDRSPGQGVRERYPQRSPGGAGALRGEKPNFLLRKTRLDNHREFREVREGVSKRNSSGFFARILPGPQENPEQGFSSKHFHLSKVQPICLI
ncbi:Microtubule-Associated Proteins 1A/1B Light Chain 3A [Manis pentadactyla]|nr:Microtubule-Associated Proteins 1A/1B Light Chain 3A [Manis pentadactyla]